MSEDEVEDDFHKRVPYLEHPDRCQGMLRHLAQCQFFRRTQSDDGTPLSVTESRFCRRHGGQIVIKQVQKRALSQYLLTKFKTQTDHFRGHEDIFSLRDEIGISRMMLQEILNRCDDANDLLLHSQKIGLLVTGIHKLVVDAKKLESQLGELMDRAALQRLCDAVIKIIGEELPADRLLAVADRISVAIGDAVAKESQ